MRDEAELQPAPGALDLRADQHGSGHQRDADDEDDEARAADLLRGERRGREHDGDRGHEQRCLAAHEIEGLEIDIWRRWAGSRRATARRPAPISRSRPKNIRRSTVNHQSESTLRSARVILMPPCPRSGRTGFDAVEAQDVIAEALPARLEIGELVVGGASRRQQHHRLLGARPAGIGGGLLDRAIERAACDVVDLDAELRGEGVRRLADQIGAGDVRKEGLEPGKPSSLRSAASDPIDVGEARQRLAGGIGIGRLGIVDEQHAPASRATCSMRWASPAKLASPCAMRSGRALASGRAHRRRRHSASYARRGASRCRRGSRAPRSTPFSISISTPSCAHTPVSTGWPTAMRLTAKGPRQRIGDGAAHRRHPRRSRRSRLRASPANTRALIAA